MGFLVISDDDYRAAALRELEEETSLNTNMICMFRVRKNAAGEVPTADDIEEVEVEFIGGATKRLFGDTAKNFVQAMGKYMARRVNPRK